MTADDYPSVAAMHHADYPSLGSLDDHLRDETKCLGEYRMQRRYAAAVMPRDCDIRAVWTDLDDRIIYTRAVIDALLEVRARMTSEAVAA